MPAHPRRNALAALAIISSFILYGSAYPFHFATPVGQADPLQFLLASLNTAPDRLDLMVNIILYMPLGFFAVRVFRFDLGSAIAFALASLLGALLSTGCEVTQFYVLERVPSASDICANTLGSMLGAFFGVLTGPRALSAWRQGASEEPFPTLLVASWLLYRLYPFVPVTSLRAYAQVLSPLFDYQFSAYDFIRYGATWLAVAAVAETIAGRQKAPRLYFSIVALVVIARLVVAARIIRPDEI